MSSPKHASGNTVAHFEPRSPTQRLARQLYQQNSILFLLGPAGCGKTLTSMGLAACDVLTPTTPRQHIVCLRPAAQADRDLGYLPGTLEEKLEPYTTPLRQALAKVTFHFPPNCIRFDAVGYVRGVNYDRCVVVVDEAQNLTFAQLRLLLSRLGPESKMIITGDLDQADVRSTGHYETDLEEVVEKLEGTPGVACLDFPQAECYRHPVITQILLKLQRP